MLLRCCRPITGRLIYVAKEVFKYIFRYRVPLRLVPVRERWRQTRNRLHSEHPGSCPRCRSRANFTKQHAERWRDQGVLHVRYDIRIESAWRKAHYFSRLQCYLNETVAALFSRYRGLNCQVSRLCHVKRTCTDRRRCYKYARSRKRQPSLGLQGLAPKEGGVGPPRQQIRCVSDWERPRIAGQ